MVLVAACSGLYTTGGLVRKREYILGAGMLVASTLSGVCYCMHAEVLMIIALFELGVLQLVVNRLGLCSHHNCPAAK